MASKGTKCILQVQFERADRTYRPGERITGKIEILSGAQSRCRGITLVPRWVARGVGPEDTAREEPLVLPGGIWRDNEKLTYAFDLPAPAGPLTYQGDSFQIEWLLDVNADLAMTADVSAVEKFTLVHGQAESAGPAHNIVDAYNPFAALAPEVAAASASRDRSPAFYTAIGLLPKIIGLPLVALILGYFVGMRQVYFEEGYEAPIIWGLVILFGSLALASAFRRRMQEKGREALNKETADALATGEILPRLPAKYWRKTPPDESQRGWLRTVGAFVRAVTALLLIVAGLIPLFERPWGWVSMPYLLLVFAGIWLAARSIRPCVRSWKFAKTALT